MQIPKTISYNDKEFKTKDRFYLDKNLSYENALMFYNKNRNLHIKIGRNDWDYCIGIYNFANNTCLYMANIPKEIEGKTREFIDRIPTPILKRLNYLKVKLENKKGGELWSVQSVRSRLKRIQMAMIDIVKVIVFLMTILTLQIVF